MKLEYGKENQCLSNRTSWSQRERQQEYQQKNQKINQKTLNQTPKRKKAVYRKL